MDHELGGREEERKRRTEDGGEENGGSLNTYLVRISQVSSRAIEGRIEN